MDYGRHPVSLISYWDEKLELWDEADVLAGRHRRASETKRAERQIFFRGAA